MTNRKTLFPLLILLAFSCSLLADSPAGKTETTSIQKLVDEMGSASFSVREQANKKLEAMGPAALPELRKAKSEDQEASGRLTRLIEKLEEKALSTALLAPKRVHLKVNDVTVLEAVAKLQELSGQPLDVKGDQRGLASRKITLDTGDVALWEALQQLCDKGGMVEQVSVPQRNPQQPNVYPRYPVPPQQAQSRTITLVEGQKLPPTCVTGSIRIRALAANSAGPPAAGELNVVLEAVAEQRLQGFGLVDAVFFSKSVDDQGQRLELLPENPMANLQNNFNMPARVMIVNGNVVPIGGVQSLLQRTMVFRFKPGPKAARVMKELSGKLVLQAQSQSEPLVTIKDVRKAAAQTFKGKDGNLIHVAAVENLDNGAVRLEMRIESPSEMAGSVPPNGFGNVMIFNGNFNGNINGVQFVNGVPVNQVPKLLPKFIEPDGKKCNAEVVSERPEFSNGLVIRHLTVVYRPTAASGGQLVLEGQRTILFEVPVNLKDIPLQ